MASKSDVILAKTLQIARESVINDLEQGTKIKTGNPNKPGQYRQGSKVYTKEGEHDGSVLEPTLRNDFLTRAKAELDKRNSPPSSDGDSIPLPPPVEELEALEKFQAERNAYEQANKEGREYKGILNKEFKQIDDALMIVRSNEAEHQSKHKFVRPRKGATPPSFKNSLDDSDLHPNGLDNIRKHLEEQNIIPKKWKFTLPHFFKSQEKEVFDQDRFRPEAEPASPNKEVPADANPKNKVAIRNNPGEIPVVDAEHIDFSQEKLSVPTNPRGKTTPTRGMP